MWKSASYQDIYIYISKTQKQNSPIKTFRRDRYFTRDQRKHKNNFINIGHQENVYHNTMKYHLTQMIITCCKKSTNSKIQVGLWSKRNCWWGYKLDQSLFKIILIPFSSLYVKNNQATEGSFTIGVTYWILKN